MRKALWIVALGLLLSVGVPTVRADGVTPEFACTSCSYLPTAGDVSFPSPSILEAWDTDEANVEDFVMLAPGDSPSDMYTWSNTLSPDGVGLASYTLSITDVRTGDSEAATGMVGDGDPLFESSISDSGTLTFLSTGGTGGSGSTPAPEPSTAGLIVIGISALLAMRRLLA
jgi:hypothetical protein